MYLPSNIFHKLADFPPAFKMTTSLRDFSDQTLAIGQMEEEEVDGSHNIFPTLAQNSFEFCSLNATRQHSMAQISHREGEAAGLRILYSRACLDKGFRVSNSIFHFRDATGVLVFFLNKAN